MFAAWLLAGGGLMGATAAASPAASAPRSAQAQLAIATPHRQPITSLTWSADGQLLLSTSMDNTARLWEVGSGALLRLFASPVASVRGIVNHTFDATFVRADRQMIIAGSDGARLWNVADGALLATLDAASDITTAVAAAERAHIAVTSGHGDPQQGARLFLRVYALDGRTRRELDVRDLNSIASLALTPDGTRLALAGAVITRATPGGVEVAPIIRVLDPRDGHLIDEVRNLNGSANWVGFDDQARLAYRTDQYVTVRAPDGSPDWQLSGQGAALSADGQLLALYPGVYSSGEDDSAAAAELYDTAGRRRVDTVPWVGARRERNRNRVNCYAFRPDGKQLAIGFADGKVAVWDLSLRMYVRVWEAQPSGPRRLQLADRDGKRVVLPTPNGVAIWDLVQGRRIELDLPLEPEVVSISPDGALVFTGSSAKTWMWDGATGRPLWNAAGQMGTLRAAVFHPVRDLLAINIGDDLFFWKARSGEQLQVRARGFHGVSTAAFSPDGNRLAVGDELGEVRVMPTMRGKPLCTVAAPGVNATVSALAFSGDGANVAVTYGNGFHQTLIYDAARCMLLRSLGEHAGAMNALAVDADDRILATGGNDAVVSLWNWRDGSPLARIPHNGDISALSLSTDGQRLFSYADYGLRMWDLSTPSAPRELLRFSELPFRRWTVADPSGRFEANYLEGGSALHWLLPNTPLRALPPEIFMRDYFEPRLAARRLACTAMEATDSAACDNAFAPVAALAELNRVQPEVKIVAVQPSPTPGNALVQVAVRAVDDPSQTNGKTASDAYDLRLFRDGQLVGRWPAASDTSKDLASWRKNTHIAPPAGKPWVERQFTVRLPRPRRPRKVVFSAYAFNEDRVKSATAINDDLALTNPPGGRPARAYVISIGVNGYEAPSRNLSFAVNDALAMRDALSRLEGFETVSVTLTSEASPASWRATKANIREVLHRLAGHAPTPGTLADVTGATRLAAAEPDDLLVISFSGHGYTEPNGSFYLLPSDSGAAEGAPSAEALGRFISSDELSDWIRPIDAGQMAMIIDACHSGAVVEQAGFKPGPMGDRGFGQLAYDKAMLILAASQPDDVAIESRRLKQGLLTYSLTHDGLMPVSRNEPSLRADQNVNRELTIAEWLTYGALRTPTLYDDVRIRALKIDYVGRDPDPGPEFRGRVLRRVQTPALFDFSQGRLVAVMSRYVVALPPGVTPLPEKLERNWVPYPDRY